MGEGNMPIGKGQRGLFEPPCWDLMYVLHNTFEAV